MRENGEAVWRLFGETIVLFARRETRCLELPRELRPLGGPALILLERYETSPAGPFISVSVGEPARLGVRPGYFFGLVSVSSAHARRAQQSYWGMPASVSAISWDVQGTTHRVEVRGGGMQVEAAVSDRAIPLMFPGRSLQVRQDGPIIISSRIRSSIAHRCRGELSFDGEHSCVGLRGEHGGFHLAGASVRRGPARHPLGVLSSFQAPLRAPEPGILGADALHQ